MFSNSYTRLLQRAMRVNKSGFVSASRYLSSNTAYFQPKKISNKERAFLLLLGSGATGLYLQNNIISADAKVCYKAVRKDIAALIDQDAEARGDGTSIGPTLVRLAWHASGTYSKADKTGGSDGATMRFKPESEFGANAGLGLARSKLEGIKAKYPGLSYADLWTLSGVVAIEEMGGPKIKWRPGRTDKDSGAACPPDGRLPDADKGAKPSTVQHIRDIFYRMGFSDREIVALAGAHALGRCHTDRSGYSGPWTNAETTFSNEYFRLLLEETWTPKQWSGPMQYEDSSKQLMMLPSDMALVWDPAFKKYVEMYAKDEALFFKDFSKAFNKLTELGCNSLPRGIVGKLLGFVGL